MRNYENEIDQLKDQVNRLSKELEKRERKMVGDVESMADRSKMYWNEAYEAMQDEWESTKGKAKDLGVQADKYAKENPWKTAGVAAALGFLAAMLAGRRRG